MAVTNIKLKLIKKGKRIGIYLLGVICVFFVLDFIFPVPANVPYAPVITARDGTVIHAYRARDGQWRMKTRLDEITPELSNAIIYKEDKNFFYHFGVNPFSLVRALFSDITHMKRVSGASTITMQCARMLEPKPRNLLSKCIEMFRAVQLETHYSKQEILQLYLNLVPYGSNIQGVKAASMLYFNKTPDQLSLAEITALSVIPNRPNHMVPGKDNVAIVRERNRWLTYFELHKVFPAVTIRDAMNEPLQAYRHNAPAGVQQFAYRMRRSYPFEKEIHTTLDTKIQLKAETIVGNYMNNLKLHMINNAAVLVVDNNTHEVIAYLGSSDFTDNFHYGQVDGVRALRSPGSTLKPLLYGLSFDNGLITPKTIIEDVPINLRGYSPENYDHTFRGNVTIEYALRNSLNIPAVKMLDRLGIDNFINRLKLLGFSSVEKHRKNLGLSLVLGGCDVRLEELTALYATFAHDGDFYPLKYVITNRKAPKGKIDTAIPVISPSACYMLNTILTELHRPDLPNGYVQAANIPKIAWKTGTSYGRKDAWSVGYNKHYTIGVWLGNFSAQGVPDLGGASTATPLLFELFNAIDQNASDEWLEAPKDLAFRLVCAETGKIPNEFCQNQIMDYYLPGISNNDLCDHKKEIWLSADEHFSYCTSCLPPTGYITKLMDNISPELSAYYESNHISYTRVPPHNPACTRSFTGQAPLITSLTNGITYLVADKEEQKLQLACTPANDVEKVYWYINDHFFASAKANQKLFFTAKTPLVKISCTDDKGRVTNIEIKVKFI